MNRLELNQAMQMAMDPTVRFIGPDGQHLEDISVFDGFGLEGFKPVTCTLPQVAFLIRWQCLCLNGTIDGMALNELAYFGRKRFIIVG